MDIKGIILIVITLAVIIFFVIKGIKEGWLKQLLETLRDAIKEAEKLYPDGHGEEKKAFVLKAIEVKCVELKIPFKVIKSLIEKSIETIIYGYNTIAK